MAKGNFLLRFGIIKRLLEKRERVTFEEINDYLKNASDYEESDLGFTQRTFQRDRKKIQKMFNVNIEYDFVSKEYFMKDDGADKDFNNRLLEEYELNALYKVENLSQYISFDKRKPLGTQYINTLLNAIKKRFILEITYHKFGGTQKQFNVEPYALKESQNRWYLVAKNLNSKGEKRSIRIFGLDRITSIELIEKKFSYPKNFNVNKYFQHCFGIINDHALKPEEVILSVHPTEGVYLNSLPLHESQRTILKNDKEYRFRLELLITFDFIMEICKYGDNIIVIKPESLKKEVYRILSHAVNQYDHLSHF